MSLRMTFVSCQLLLAMLDIIMHWTVFYQTIKYLRLRRLIEFARQYHLLGL